jgi:hypothetical protein
VKLLKIDGVESRRVLPDWAALDAEDRAALEAGGAENIFSPLRVSCSAIRAHILNLMHLA